MKTRAIHSVTALGLLGVMSLTVQGCSVNRALNGPAPVATERVRIGESRNTIISVLGSPKITDSKANCTPEMNVCRTDIHEFTDGYSGASKIRVLLYIAGDVFTLGLSELIFWPIELAAGDGARGRAIVTYGLDDISKTVLLTKADGTPWANAQPVVGR